MHVLSLVLLLAVSKLASAAPTPLFGLDLGEININTDGETSDAGTVSVSQEDITSTLVRPALFARVAYCSSPSVLNMTCGEQCDALPNVKILVAGGDDGLVPNFFVAHDVDTDTIVVAHQGTEPKNLLSDLNDLNFLQVDANTTVLPQANSKLAVSDVSHGPGDSSVTCRGRQDARRVRRYAREDSRPRHVHRAVRTGVDWGEESAGHRAQSGRGHCEH